MENLLLIFACLVLGFAFKQIPIFPKDTHKGINTYIIWVALPCLALIYIPKLEFSVSLIWLVLMAWVIFGLSILFFKVMAKVFKWSRQTEGCLVLACGLSNTSFVGFPLLEFLYNSKQPLQYAIVCDQAGSFLVLATVGLIVAMNYGGDKPTPRVIFKKLIYFPPFIAFLLALLLVPFGGVEKLFLQINGLEQIGTILENVLIKLAAPLVTLALFSVGLQIEFSKENFKLFNPFFFGLLFKLFLAPLAIYFLYLLVFTEKNMAFQVGILEAAMAPMVTGVLLAQEYKLNPKLGGFLLAVGIPLSIATVYLWYLFLN
ncbi:AEC family transporter [Bernardetia litoralis]|uniref:AEC family transporter n=1 Tax=Bernardetia litoralis TaxID=999 RepID=UPI0002DC3A54|nr:AEC family transporter [Bernardetia litoralis]